MRLKMRQEKSIRGKKLDFLFGVIIIVLGFFIIINPFIEIIPVFNFKNLFITLGCIIISLGFLLTFHFKRKYLYIGASLEVIGFLLLILIIVENGLTPLILENATMEIIMIIFLNLIGIAFISRKKFKNIIAIYLVLIGGFLIINYFVGIIPILAETLLFCTLGVFIGMIGFYILIPFIKKIQFLYFGVILTTFGIMELITGFQAIVEEITFTDFLEIGETVIGGMFFTIGMVLLGCILLPYIVIGLSYLLKPILRFMRPIMSRNVLRNARRTQNTFAMVSLGLAFLIMISTVLNSMSAGIYPGAKLTVGGDLRIGWYGGYAPLYYADDLRSVDHVTSLVAIRYIYLNCIIDEYTSDYYIRFFIINTTEYAELHKEPTLLDIISPSGLSVHDFIHLLDKANSTIIYSELTNALNKGIGDFVNASSSEFTTTTLEIVGICEKMPGIYYTFREYSPPIYSVFISWQTFLKLTGYNVTTYPNDVFYFAGIDDLSNDITVRTQFFGILEEYRTCSESHVRFARTQVEEYSGIINTIYVTLNQILFIALLVSLLGLAITMNISIRQRRTEIGILRAIGISKNQILKVIFGEILTISLAGILFGSITGIIAGFLLTYFFPFIEFIPVIFTISWLLLGIYWTILLGVALSSSVIPAYNVSKLQIVESIRIRSV